MRGDRILAWQTLHALSKEPMDEAAQSLDVPGRLVQKA